jgi:ribose-phosphate pyrophosphokinase
MASFFRERLDPQAAVVVSPDAGGVARATDFRDQLKAGLHEMLAGDEMAIAFKRRTPEGAPTVIDMVGDVRGRPAVIYDDMIQSGQTLLQVVERLYDKGATEVHAAAVHADFTPGALDALLASPLHKLVLSDTTAATPEERAQERHHGSERLSEPTARVEIVSSARILAQAIWRVHAQQSVGWIFDTLRRDGELPPVERTD